MNKQNKLKSKINTDLKIDLHLNYKINTELDYFIAGPEMEADRQASANNTDDA